MISWIIGLALLVIVSDTIYLRAQIHLRRRAAHHARRVNHKQTVSAASLGPEGWGRVDNVRQIFGRDAGEVGEAVEDGSNPFDSILGRRGRR
jgi:hypothetical protein